MTRPDGPDDYVRRVSEETRRYLRELLGDNDRLRARVADLERELADTRSQRAQLDEQCLEIERQNANLANLYVASYRLHATVERHEVLATIQEILVNLVGSETLAVFETNGAGDALDLVAWQGIEPERWRRVRFGDGAIGRAAQSGERLVRDGADGHAEAGEPRACVPLKLSDRVIGAIALFELLPQKPRFAEVDFELFDLLATHAATALYCSRAAAP